MENLNNGIIGPEGFFPSPKHTHIPCFNAESSHIGSYIRSRLVDHTYHSQGYPLFPDQQPIGPFFHFFDLTNGILKLHDLPQTICNPHDPFTGKRQAFYNGSFQPHLFTLFQICCIGLQDARCRFLE